MEVYFDNSATTKPYDEVIDSMVYTMKNYYANPSSAHKLGMEAEKKMEEAREVIAHTLGCSKNEIIFTSGGSESNNFLLKGFAKPKTNIITTEIEHPSIINACMELEEEGIKVTFLKVDSNGKIDLDELSNALNKDTSIVSIMHVNNEIGAVQDLEKIAKCIREHSSRAKFHVDAVQSYGKLHIDVNKLDIDLLSISGHKIHGPKGIGVAYVKKGLSPRPLIAGGGQEKNMRSGTENIAAMVGFSAAVKKVFESIDDNYKKVSEVKNYFIQCLNSIEDVKVNNAGEAFSPYILSVSFGKVKGEVLLHMLEGEGVYVSTGSACSSKRNSESYVLKAAGLTNDQVRGTIRFSFSDFNTKEEVDYTIEKLKKCLSFLRRIKR